MLVRNGRNILSLLASNRARQIKSIDGTLYSANMTNIISYFGYSSIIVGTGTTPASIEDYDLANNLTDGLTISFVSRTNTGADRSYSSDEALMFVNCLITNETENDITITEVGLIMSASSAYTSSNTYLLSRTVLSDGLVLEAGKTYQLRIDVN